MILRIAELEIDPVQLPHYNALLAEEIEAAVRLESGVIFLKAVALKDDPSQVRVLECYADDDAYQQHLATPHFLKYKTHTAGMVKSLRLLEVDAIALKAKDGIFSA